MKALRTIAKKRQMIREERYFKGTLITSRTEILTDVKNAVEIQIHKKGKNADGSEFMNITLIVE
jgi:hypothetical protein